jgi:hypothetical protein
MKFDPKTSKEINEMAFIKPGKYRFEVREAKETVSKKGNEMLVVTLKIYLDNGDTRMLTDYLLEAFPKKLFNFCQVVGLSEEYAHGDLRAHMLLGLTGFVKIDVEDERPKDGGGFWPEKNTVKDYVKDYVYPGAEEETPSSQNIDLIDDDIPF